jgi:hypothetical protein
MTPADRRIMELIDKWLKSIDLHLKYAALSDVDYACAQKWPKHDRPTRWVLEVARQKVLELKGHCESRQTMGDGKFAESLELMAFLANLVGIQHIQRFIPLAEGPEPGTAAASATQTVEAPVLPKAGPTRAKATPGDETTREMPRLKVTAGAAKPVITARTVQGKPEPRLAAQAPKGATAGKGAGDDLKGKIIADAVRLLKWGKPWHELAELIERIADRPSVAEIRKVLRAHKGEIESRAGISIKN